MALTLVVLSGYALAFVAPWIQTLFPKTAGRLFAILPLAISIFFLRHIAGVADGDVLRETHAWVPALDIHLAFYMDGLSILFAIIISGVGIFIVLYSGDYLKGHRQLGRFYAYLLAFMASMLGIVLADNVITLFIFWELTGVTSFFLIGFDHEREAARKAAWQALLVTGFGGLALLAGLLLMSSIGGTADISSLLSSADTIRGHDLYLPIVCLVLLGAFTKSAQFPFHFWLPNAMEAPTPVSAYLHSATMVKAGIYLVARMSPILGDTLPWTCLIGGAGAITALLGAYLATQQVIVKRILAYSTVSALGLMMMLLGIGTEAATQAAMGFLVAHALYKATLFLVAGSLDHETGERNIERLGGLRRAMPITATAAVLAGLSMAGIPPFIGFVGKEAVYEASLEASYLPLIFAAVAVLSSVAFVMVAAMMSITVFFGDKKQTPKSPSEAPLALWLGPAVFAMLALVFGLAPGRLGDLLIAPAASSILGRHSEAHLALWHGVSLPVLLSVVSLIGGLALYACRAAFLRGVAPLNRLDAWGPAQGYEAVVSGMNSLAKRQTAFFQHGYLRLYILVIILATSTLIWWRLIVAGLPPIAWPSGDIPYHETGLTLLLLIAILGTVLSKSRLAAIAALGIVGFGVGLIFVLFRAPDLALTQFTVETLTVVLFMLAFYKLPSYAILSKPSVRIRDLLVALSIGTLMATLVMVANSVQFYPPISTYFETQSAPEAHGRNIVNVILVDFRGFDTLGEITVLAVAGIGVSALLKFRMKGEET